MLRSVEGVYHNGKIELAETPPGVKDNTRVIVTFLTEPAAVDIPETALLSEPALAEGWNRPEEDAAWSHLQPGR